MTRKLTTILAAGALSLGGLVYLQAKEPGEHGPKHEHHGPGPDHMMGTPLEPVSKDLNLTDDQKAKLQEVFKAQREAMKDLSPEERREKMKESREAMNAKIKAILTAEQYAKWEKIRDERRPGGPGNENGPGEKRRGPAPKKD